MHGPLTQQLMANDSVATPWLRPCELPLYPLVATTPFGNGLYCSHAPFCDGAIVRDSETPEKLIEKVHEGTLEQELQDAITYCTQKVQDPEWMIAVGHAASSSTPREVLKKLNGDGAAAYLPDEVKFGGVLGWLDLSDRVKDIKDMDVGRMRWACEVLDETHKFSKVLGDIVVRGEFAAADVWAPAVLRRVESDAAIDVVCLSIYWHMPTHGTEEHPLKNLCRDLVFSAQRVGQGLDLQLERFKRKVDEEKKRQVLGQSAWRWALDCKAMVQEAEPQRAGMKDVDLLASVLATRPELAKDWKADTCSRYLAVAGKITEHSKTILSRWELMFQRNTLLDGITLLRAAATATAGPTEFELIVETLYFEQTCKLRRSIAPKGRGHATDATNTMRGIVLRQALYAYLKQTFPKIANAIEHFGTWKWFRDEYGMTETGHMPKTLPDDSDEDPDTPGKGVCSSPHDPSRFASKEKLTKLCTMVAKGRHDYAFTQLGKTQGHAETLDLAHESMRTVKNKIQEIWTDYIAEFPPDRVPTDVPGATLDMQHQPGQGLCPSPTEIKATSRIESEHEYQMGLAEWGKRCETAVNDSVEDYINSTIVLIQCEYETAVIEGRLRKIPFMNEPGRKLFAYDSLCREPVDWGAIKRHKRSFFAGAKVTMDLQQVGDEGGDTLAVLKNVYMAFRTERASDHLSEDIVACIVPGRSGDSPINDTLNTAWKSLKALGCKHVGPKIGNIRMAQEDVLTQVYARGAWNRVPEHHMLFTYQANPMEGGTRKRMRYLKEQTRMGDTFFNEWPVPMYQLAQMPKLTMAEHDQIFALDTAIDEGAEDGAGAALVNDLGDKVVPFPREFHVKLWQEMIHVWGIESAVLFMVGSGQALLAFVLERKRAVGVVKNATQKKFVKANLAQTVKTLGLAPDRRPPKPAELVAWESRRAVGGAVPIGKAGPPASAQGTGGAGAQGTGSAASAPSILTMPTAAPASASAPNILTMPLPPGAGTPAPPAPKQAPPTGPSAAAGLAAFGQSALR